MDKRLEAAASLFPAVTVGADIGANHGLLACRLLQSQRVQRMWVTDLSADALSQARKNIADAGLADRVTFAVGDGFSALDEPVGAAAILGMGGQTIADIITSAEPGRLPPALVVSGHTDQETVRYVLCKTGYEITGELLVRSAGRFYILTQARLAAAPVLLDDRALFLGPCLTKQTSPDYRAYLRHKLSAYAPSRSEEGHMRYQWLKEEAARADSPDSP